MRTRWNAACLAIAAASQVACADGIGSVFMSWHIGEGNPNAVRTPKTSDPRSELVTRAPSLRPCRDGAGITRFVGLTITDTDYPDRSRTHHFDCSEGEALRLDSRETASERLAVLRAATETNGGIELMLRHGDYELTLSGHIAEDGKPGARTTQVLTTDIWADDSRGKLYELPQSTAPIELNVSGTSECDRVAFEIRYYSPNELWPTRGEHQLMYRQLYSRDGLTIDSLVTHDCSLAEGRHIFDDVDYGHYRFVARTDDNRFCTVDLLHLPLADNGPTATQVDIDLSECQAGAATDG